MATLTLLDVYLTNVWRLIFEATRGEGGRWEAIDDSARFDRIAVMGMEEGRDLQADLDSAQAAIDTGQNAEQWKSSIRSAL